ncbi:MAG: beta strand repeat-containing protein, partial [Ferruginibacter sp.]
MKKLLIYTLMMIPSIQLSAQVNSFSDASKMVDDYITVQPNSSMQWGSNASNLIQEKDNHVPILVEINHTQIHVQSVLKNLRGNQRIDFLDVKNKPTLPYSNSTNLNNHNFSKPLDAGDVSNIVAAEYFIDVDPGVGNGISIPVTAGAIVNFTANIPANLAVGFHILAIRMKDADGIWGMYESRGFYISSTSSDVSNIVAAEYFYDTDPGFGNGISIPVTAGAIVNFTANLPTSLTNGFHFLAIRTRDANGRWGAYESRGFYIGSNSSDVADIVAAEYFFDTDPGVGNGTAISVTPGSAVNFTANIPTSLAAGFHFLAIRTKDATGKWGYFESRGFFIGSSTADAADIVAAEYFFDTDPGVGNGTAISVTPGSTVNFTANLPTSLAAGFHFIAIRTKDATGKWGFFESRGFFIGSSTADAANIVAAEYFFDTDPGVGNGTSITVNAGAVVNFNVTLPTSLASGFHFLAIRTKDADGKWGLFESRGFYISTSSSNLPDIVAAEYFLDVDPGVGNGTAITIPTPGAVINETFSLPLNVSIPQGHHEFALRVKNSAGQWSLFQRDTFFIPFITVPKVTLGTIGTSFCAGAAIPIPFTVNLPFGTVNVFTAQLSNAAGSFASAVNIGTLASTDAGTINATIPANTPAGSNYRIRIIANSPNDTSNVSFNPITIGRVPELNYSINGATTTCIGVQAYSASATETATYTWQLSGGGTLTPTTSSASINFTTAGLHTISLTASNSCGNGQTKTLSVRVFEAAPTIIPNITVSNRVLTANAASVAQGVTGYQWYKDAVLIVGQTNQSITIPNLESGNYTVAYTNTCGIGTQSAAVAMGIAKLDQTVTFTPVAAKTFGDAPFTVSATASSTLPISAYAIVSGPAIIVGNTVTITGAGTIVVSATQDGNNTYNAATGTINITVNKALATITLSNNTVVYDGNTKADIATTNPLGLNHTITYNGSTNLPINVGSYATIATITSPNYSGNNSGNFTINKANQSINLTPINDKSYNSAPFAVIASATSGLPVTLSIVTVPVTGVATISGNTITLLGQGGTVTVTANQAGNQNFNAANSVSVSFNVTPPLTSDVQLLALVSPVGGCNLGTQANVTVKIKNLGTSAATNFPVAYSINNGAVQIDTFRTSIAAGAEENFTFTEPANFATTNTAYILKTFTALTGDQRLNNDTLISTVVRLATNPTSVSADTSICNGDQAILRAIGGSSYSWTNGPSTANYTVSPIITTTYQVSITDFAGCSTNNYSVTVTVNAKPIVSAGANQAILRGSSTTLTATGGSSYRWNNGATTASITVSPQNTTTYQVTATNASGCSATSSVTVTVNFSAININPSITDFGAVVVDSIKNSTIVVTNSGTLTETINSLTGLTAPFTTTFIAPITVAPGATVSIPIRFAPTATLFYQSNVALSTSAGTFNLTIKGRGVLPAPAWSITPPNFDYGNVALNTIANKDFTITNTGNVRILVSTVSSSLTRFVGTVNGVTTIPVGGSIVLNVKFTPLALTSYNGTITVRTSTPGLSLIRAIVSGTGYIDGPAPILQFLSVPTYNDTCGVSPSIGTPGNYTYSIKYKHPNGVAPKAGFPKIGIDKNGDHDFADADEGIYSLTKEGNTQDWLSGETYTYIAPLTVSSNYGYQFFATDSIGNSTTINPYKSGPLVTREILDLHIFASDISFSNNTPAVNQNFQVNAIINNGSPYPAADVKVRFYYKDSLFLFNDTIPFIDGNSTVTLTHTLNFSPDGFYPIKVWIDSANTLGEGNILNN